MKILAISGSLRAASNNTALLRAVARLAPADISVELFRDLGNLPLFNPDIGHGSTRHCTLSYTIDSSRRSADRQP